MASTNEESAQNLDTQTKITKEYKSQEDSVSRINTAFSKLNTASEALNDSVKNITNTFQKAASLWVSFDILDNLQGVIQNMVKTNSELHRTVINAGLGKQAVSGIQEEVTKLQIKFGASRQEAVGLIKTLTEKQYQGNLESAVNSAYLFHKATGLSTDAVADLTMNLSREANMSDKAISASMANMLTVQQRTGISKQGMEALTSQISKSAANMRIFGKSSDAIVSMTTNTAKLVSAMEKVGVAANKTLEIIDNLTNPEKVTDNIALYSQLGISISDALSGEDITGQVETGMKELGQKLKSMGAIAGAQYAKALNVDYRTAIQAADMSIDTEPVQTAESEAEDKLSELATATMDSTEKIQAGINKMSGAIQSLGPVLLTVGSIAVALIQKLFKDISKKADELSDKVTGKVKNVKKEAEKPTASSKISDKSYKNIMGSTNQKAIMNKMGESKHGQRQLEGIEARLAEEYEKTLSELVKHGEDDKKLRKTNNKRIKEIDKEIKNSSLDSHMKEALLKEQEKLKEQIKNSSNVTKEYNTKLDKIIDSKNDVAAAMNQKSKGGIRNIGSRVRENARNKVADIKEGFSNKRADIKNDFINIKEKNGGGFLGGAKATKSIAKAGIGKAAGGIGKIVSAVSKALGPIMIVITAVVAILKAIIGNSQGLQDKITTLKNKLEKMLKPILDQAIQILTPAFDMLDAVLPSLSELLDTAMELLKPLLNIIVSLLPILTALLIPIVKVLNFLLKPVIAIVNLISKLIGKISEVVQKLPFVKRNAEKTAELNESLKENTEATEKTNEQAAEQLTIDKRGNVNSSGIGTNSSSEATTEKVTAVSTNSSEQSITQPSAVTQQNISAGFKEGIKDFTEGKYADNEYNKKKNLDEIKEYLLNISNFFNEVKNQEGTGGQNASRIWMGQTVNAD